MSVAHVARRLDRMAVMVALTATATIAWALTARFAAGMGMPAEAMGMAATSAAMPAELALVSGMWAAMMVGMMVPSASPMVLAYSDWIRRGPSGHRATSITSFLSGYVLVWVGFSLAAAVVQVTLQRAGHLSAMGATSRPATGAVVLVLAGLFQVTPWKQSCLRRCRTPLGFLIAEWRDGASGALIMGVRHGAYCVGCCWALMGVLFVVGTMNTVWMAVIAGLVLAEKIAPRSLRIHYASAVILIGWGSLTLVTAVG